MKVLVVTNEQQLKDAYHVREQVFIQEQGVSRDLEHDAHDETAIHLVGYLNDVPVAVGRIRVIDDHGKFERIAVLKAFRRQQLGKQFVQAMEDVLIKKGVKKAILNAQAHALNFYQQLEYQITSEPFNEAGIEHVSMEKNLYA